MDKDKLNSFGIDKMELAKLLKEAADEHHKYEENLGKKDENWPLWYATYILDKLSS